MNLIVIKNLVNLAKKITVYSVVLALLGTIFAPVSSALAQIQEPLVISNIVINKIDDTATISWSTNRKAVGRVDYGLSPDNYTWSVSTNLKELTQAITIFGLNPETDYYFRVFAEDDFSEIGSFEQNFETLKEIDNRTPLISNVTVVYLTGKTATIQWETDEDSTSVVDYGMTTSYGGSVSDGRKVKIHDITVSGLVEGTFYHFRVKSADKNNNIARWFDMTFRTNLTSNTDNDNLIIYSVEPASANDIKVTETSAIISWRTNKLSEGWVRYGKSSSYGITVATQGPRDFLNSVTLTNLTPGTNYYFDIKARDIFGKETRSNGFSFTTQSNTPGTAPALPRQGVVLGASTCAVNLGITSSGSPDFGYYGSYFNLPQSHPDMESWEQDVKTAGENDWYSDQYYRFSRVDSNIQFGSRFFPLDEDLPGDPNHFAVNWRGIVSVPANATYKYKVRSDDDSWVFIDGVLTTNLQGVHGAKSTVGVVSLSTGYHTLEIYYADRQRTQAEFSFTPDSQWKVYPLPTGCSLQDVLDFNGSFSSGGSTSQTGLILGASNTDDGSSIDNGSTSTNQTYACNPDLGYSRITKLYRTTVSPDVWAILETGQKHYITSPESFNLYQCNWSRVQTVSQSFLNSFDNATLARTPDNATIYHLFDRPVVQWLKINIPSPTTFISYVNNYWGNVARINHLDIASYPDVRLVKEETGSAVYLIEGNSKRKFSSAEVFENLGYDWAEVVSLNQTHLDSYTQGTDIQ